MTLNELDLYFNSFLKNENFASDISKNGIQIANSLPNEKQITKVAFAVDACEATALKAVEQGAQLLFVHHGLFWGGCDIITNIHYKRIATFIKNDLALYASHIPLDANPLVGNNYGLASRLGLENLQPFGSWRGMRFGVRGFLPNKMDIFEIAEKVLNGQKPAHILPFGKKEIKTVAIISGGSGDEHTQAIAEGIDLYITGEIGHENYHSVKEYGLNLIAGGHYQTETIGVNLVKEKLEKDTGLKTIFIDEPTGL